MGCPVSLALQRSGFLPGRATRTNHHEELLHRYLRPCQPNDLAGAAGFLALCSAFRVSVQRASTAGLPIITLGSEMITGSLIVTLLAVTLADSSCGRVSEDEPVTGRAPLLPCGHQCPRRPHAIPQERDDRGRAAGVDRGRRRDPEGRRQCRRRRHGLCPRAGRGRSPDVRHRRLRELRHRDAGRRASTATSTSTRPPRAPSAPTCGPT